MGTALVIATQSLVATPCSSSQAAVPPPEGTFRQAQVLGLEQTGATCMRVWLEIRTYRLAKQSDDLFVGNYGNIVISRPVDPSRDPCIYSLPASQPVSSQMRNWTLLGKRNGDSRWQLTGTPSSPPSAAELGIGLQEVAFTTEIDVESADVIVDTDAALGPGGMRFQRERAPPSALDRALHEWLSDLNGGECARNADQTTPANVPDRRALIGEICDLRRRMVKAAGEYQFVSVVDTISLDGYRLPDRPYQEKDSYFVQFNAHYAKGETIPGHILLERSPNGDFTAVRLWH